MKLLLTSAGMKNASIHDALVDLLGKPIAEANALCIPTAAYGHPWISPVQAWKDISGQEPEGPLCGLGWNSVGILELTALPSINRERWVSWVREADILLVNGGDPIYLCYWIQQSGLAELMPSLHKTVWVGLSAGSMVMTPRVGEDFVSWTPPTNGTATDRDRTLGVVDFSIFPHLDHEMLPYNTMTNAKKWAANLGRQAYAIDDETAIKVSDGVVEVISKGHWILFSP
jgi:dipeptidase E